ncbi:MAG: YsnF/AvaK domain-containing protein [Aridibacter sp.]
MTHTVVGIFDDISDARQAMDQLIKGGFIKKDVDISQGKVSEKTAAAVTNDRDTDIGDSISNFFSNLFGEDDTRAGNYAEVAREANGILTVQADSEERAARAAEIMDNNNAIDIENRAAQYQRTAAAGRTDVDSDTATIPIIEENLNVGKRTVETGGVRVRSQIVEKPVEETLRLREEHVIVNRRPVDRAVTDADMDNLQEGTIEVTERAEKAVVGKQARVVEEVEVGKEVSEREQTITDTVRKTDVEVEEIDTDVDVDTDVKRKNA